MSTRLCRIPGCNNPAMPSRRLCHEHRLEQNREYAKKRPVDARRIYRCRCTMCGEQFMGFRKDSTYCSEECRLLSHQCISGDARHRYILSGERGKRAFEHRVIAREILGRELTSDEAIHHEDLNPVNNNPSNLLILSRKNHAKLHAFLKVCSTEMTLPDSPFRSKEMKDVVVPATKLWSELNNVELDRLSDHVGVVAKGHTRRF